MEENNNKRFKIKNIIDWIINGFLAFLVIVVGYYFVQSAILKSPTPSVFGYSYYYITTGSMEDYISIGDIVIVKKTNDYKENEVITFLKEGDSIPTTHRIIVDNGDGSYITKGDANNAEDRLVVYQDEIVGEVVEILEDVDTFTKWILYENGYIYILCFIGVVILGISLIKKEKTSK